MMILRVKCYTSEVSLTSKGCHISVKVLDTVFPYNVQIGRGGGGRDGDGRGFRKSW